MEKRIAKEFLILLFIIIYTVITFIIMKQIVYPKYQVNSIADLIFYASEEYFLPETINSYILTAPLIIFYIIRPLFIATNWSIKTLKK